MYKVKTEYNMISFDPELYAIRQNLKKHETQKNNKNVRNIDSFLQCKYVKAKYLLKYH